MGCHFIHTPFLYKLLFNFSFKPRNQLKDVSLPLFPKEGRLGDEWINEIDVMHEVAVEHLKVFCEKEELGKNPHFVGGGVPKEREEDGGMGV
jgi:hypothetical protein